MRTPRPPFLDELEARRMLREAEYLAGELDDLIAFASPADPQAQPGPAERSAFLDGLRDQTRTALRGEA